MTACPLELKCGVLSSAPLSAISSRGAARYGCIFAPRPQRQPRPDCAAQAALVFPPHRHSVRPGSLPGRRRFPSDQPRCPQPSVAPQQSVQLSASDRPGSDALDHRRALPAHRDPRRCDSVRASWPRKLARELPPASRGRPVLLHRARLDRVSPANRAVSRAGPCEFKLLFARPALPLGVYRAAPLARAFSGPHPHCPCEDECATAAPQQPNLTRRPCRAHRRARGAGRGVLYVVEPTHPRWHCHRAAGLSWDHELRRRLRRGLPSRPTLAGRLERRATANGRRGARRHARRARDPWAAHRLG